MSRIFVVIPAFEPGQSLLNVCGGLYDKGIQDVLIVDDGSGDEYRELFKEISTQYGYQVFRHAVNLGKGRALKDAFNFILTEIPGCIGVVTADSDGQHTIGDIIKCMKELRENSNKLILGCRSFDSRDIPWKSKFGNNLTKFMFSFACGIKVSDTQTGLRGIPADYMKRFCTVKGERFEYETNMLLEMGSSENIREVPIETIYESRGNHKTHFNPILDSVRIYKSVLAYGASSLLASIIDFIVFTCAVKRGGTVGIATLIARACAAVVNFTINRKAVFTTKGKIVPQMIKYLLLVALSGTVSATFISYISKWFGINVVVVKVIVETLLFFFNYYMQRNFVFRAFRKRTWPQSYAERKATDWTLYYEKERSWFSTYTQQFTLKEILKHLPEQESHNIVELGGGNSCFASGICEARSINTYDIIDNNALAVDKFNHQDMKAGYHAGYKINLLGKCEGLKPEYDFVYSVGLIEHFLGEDIRIVIERHFDCCQQGGIVLITFPTPTLKYRFFRRCMELAGAWQFHDEVPLTFDEVKDIFERKGEVLTHYVNRKLPLTQMIVVARKF